jgi:Zn-dependent protease
MMHWRLGSVAGFPVALKPGFFILLALAGFGVIGRGGPWAVGTIVVLFVCILAHELGHALVARQRGVGISGIDLGFFGGAAKMTSSPTCANDEIAIAAAGPAVSVLISAFGFGLAAVLSPGMPYAVAHALGWMNLIIAAFNLLPALPMDGGRILRAVLSRWGSYVTATDRAVLVSRVFSVAFLIAGFMYSSNLALLAPILWMWGSRERLIARMIGSTFVQDKHGYRQRNSDDVEVLTEYPAGPYRAASQASYGHTGLDPLEMLRAFAQRSSKVSVRRHNGRVIIEVDPQS